MTTPVNFEIAPRQLPNGQWDASQYYQPDELVTSPSYIDPNLRAPPMPQYPEVQSDTLRYRTRANAAFGIGIVLLLLFVTAVVLYLLFGDKYTKQNVNEDLEDGGDIDAKLGSLTVQNNTILGDSSSDRLTVNASLISDIVPSQDSSHNLGSASKKWDVTYTDAIVFEDGVSMITDSYGVQLTGGFGYQRKIEEISTGSGVTHTLTNAESGYLYVLSGTDLGNTDIVLPHATGSGVFYDFVAGTSISPSGGVLLIDGDGDNIQGSMKIVSENTGPGSTEVSTIITTTSSSENLTVSEHRPINSSTGYQGIMTGSSWRLVDYGNSVWAVSGTMILQSGPSVGQFTTPFE